VKLQGLKRKQLKATQMAGGSTVLHTFDSYAAYSTYTNILAIPKVGLDMTRSEHVAATWAKSSFSFSNGNCVEVAGLPGGSVGVRDSRDPAGPVLRFTRGGWDTFLGGARRGKFDGFASMASPVDAPDAPRRGVLGRLLDGAPGPRRRAGPA
jgi:hypothetical protein